ncbi:crossover junction endodeoxyribonuclease RuvC [Micrococcales bacterium 31B]|nr:crossover junction endodeoxyribonuclease RuvC [Micrococcales bacterium 31B]
MKIMGIDPGLTRCGVGVVESWGARRVGLVDVTVVRTLSTDPIGDRLKGIYQGIVALIEKTHPDVIAIERVFAQDNLSSLIGTSQAAGVAILAAALHDIPVATHTPSEVKAAVTGYGNAEKAQVQTMVKRILGLTEAPKPADAADSLAIAICHVWRGTLGLGNDFSGGDVMATTAAQRAWKEAERAARASGAKPKRYR